MDREQVIAIITNAKRLEAEPMAQRYHVPALVAEIERLQIVVDQALKVGAFRYDGIDLEILNSYSYTHLLEELKAREGR